MYVTPGNRRLYNLGGLSGSAHLTPAMTAQLTNQARENSGKRVAYPAGNPNKIRIQKFRRLKKKVSNKGSQLEDEMKEDKEVFQLMNLNLKPEAKFFKNLDAVTLSKGSKMTRQSIKIGKQRSKSDCQHQPCSLFPSCQEPGVDMFDNLPILGKIESGVLV